MDNKVLLLPIYIVSFLTCSNQVKLKKLASIKSDNDRSHNDCGIYWQAITTMARKPYIIERVTDVESHGQEFELLGQS